MSRVLVVDDERPILRALGVGLRARGYEVELAETGEDALRCAATRPPDVVILDLGLPGIDGIDVVRGLRAGRRSRSSSCPPATRRPRRSPPSTPAPTTTSPSRSAWTSSWPGCGPPARGPRPAEDRPWSHRRLHASTWRPSGSPTPGDEIRLTPDPVAPGRDAGPQPGALVSQQQLLQEVWGPQYATETNYLRVFMAHIRHKLEPDPWGPRYFLTEPGMGYRFQRPTDLPPVADGPAANEA